MLQGSSTRQSRLRATDNRLRAESQKRYTPTPATTDWRKNGWQLAEYAGYRHPRTIQRVLDRSVWDAEAVRDDRGAFVVEQLGDSDGVLVVDETGFLKKGPKSCGVARQYSGTAGRIEHCQIGVLLGYASARGRAGLDRALYPGCGSAAEQGPTGRADL